MTRSLRTLVGLIALLFVQAAFADKPRFGDTLTIGLGGMSHRGKATLAVTRGDAPVDKLTFQDLGITDETEVFWGDLNWQFAERWKFRLNYSSFDAKGRRVQSTGGNWDELEWEVGARLSTDFEMELYIADLTWDFLKTENGHLGVGLGLHAVDLDLAMLLEVGGSVDGESGFIPVDGDANSVLAPLPNVSLSGGYLIGDKVYLHGSLGFFSLDYDKYDGNLFSARGAVEWRPWKHVGLGAAYQYVQLDLEVDSESKQESYDFEFYGPVLFLSIGF
jgi:hypothetical protein